MKASSKAAQPEHSRCAGAPCGAGEAVAEVPGGPASSWALRVGSVVAQFQAPGRAGRARKSSGRAAGSQNQDVKGGKIKLKQNLL